MGDASPIKFRAAQIMGARARENSKIGWKLNKVVKEWVGEQGNFKGVILVDTLSNEEEIFKCDGAFLAIGHKQMTNFLDGQIELDNHGYIVPKENTMTNVSGIFAAGDVVDTRYRQAITAAGMGCMAAIDAEKWLEEN